MSRGYDGLNVDDFKASLPSDEEISKRREGWEALFEKFSNCDDGEEDGIDPDALYKEDENGDEDTEDTLDESIDIDSEVEAPTCSDVEATVESEVGAPVDKHETQMVTYGRGSETFAALPRDEQLKRITVTLSPEVVGKLREIVSRRVAELDQQNLPFWHVSQESVQAKMSYDEKYINVKTPAKSFGGRSGQSSMDLQRTVTSSRGNPKLNLSNVTFNGVPALHDNTFKTSTTLNDLPSSIQSLCQMNMNFSLKITERNYEVQVHGRELPGILNELNVTRSTSASLNCLEPIVISSSSDEEPSEPSTAPQKKLNKIQIKKEPKGEAKKKPKVEVAKVSKALKPLKNAAQDSAAPKAQSKTKLVQNFKSFVSDEELFSDVEDEQQKPDNKKLEDKKPEDKKKEVRFQSSLKAESSSSARDLSVQSKGGAEKVQKKKEAGIAITSSRETPTHQMRVTTTPAEKESS